jgi:hypothetical protein
MQLGQLCARCVQPARTRTLSAPHQQPRAFRVHRERILQRELRHAPSARLDILIRLQDLPLKMRAQYVLLELIRH